MANFSSEKYIVYESEYGVPPAEQNVVDDWDSGITLTETNLPAMSYEGYIFLGWSYNGTLVKAGDVISGSSGDLIFTAVWQKQTTYVMVDKDDLVSIADTVRNLSGSTEKFNVQDLKANAVTTTNEMNVKIDEVNDLVGQIKASLDGKAAGGGTQPQYMSGTKLVTRHDEDFIVNGLGFKPTRFIIEFPYGSMTGIEFSKIEAPEKICFVSWPSNEEEKCFAMISDAYEAWSQKIPASVTDDGFCVPWGGLGYHEFVSAEMQSDSTYTWHAWCD